MLSVVKYPKAVCKRFTPEMTLTGTMKQHREVMHSQKNLWVCLGRYNAEFFNWSQWVLGCYCTWTKQYICFFGVLEEFAKVSQKKAGQGESPHALLKRPITKVRSSKEKHSYF